MDWEKPGGPLSAIVQDAVTRSLALDDAVTVLRERHRQAHYCVR